jgi:hypothetical protein
MAEPVAWPMIKILSDTEASQRVLAKTGLHAARERMQTGIPNRTFDRSLPRIERDPIRRRQPDSVASLGLVQISLKLFSY